MKEILRRIKLVKSRGPLSDEVIELFESQLRIEFLTLGIMNPFLHDPKEDLIAYDEAKSELQDNYWG
ncbi:MAG: hypothetical protein KJO69_04840 [Gammaproteobacteria bacterium]|nr:hypothetical protein [Gammaproteobacteria bacterium]